MSPRRTPLHPLHVELGARMVDFAGYEMPVRYGSIQDEHRAVRETAGLFDVSHMGQLHFRGPGAVTSLERLLTCPVASLRPGRVRYGCLCNEAGGTVDDVTVYRVGEGHLLLVVNAANVEKDRAWCAAHLDPGTELADESARTALLALQGPRSEPILARVCDLPLGGLRRFRFAEGKVAGVAGLVSRTGYTGSDGFELYLPADGVIDAWEALLAAGRDQGLVPAGLGARDTLRLEAALPLYGHELDDGTSPLEARLDRFVKLEAGGFLGHTALLRQRERGLERVLVGFVLEGRGIARAGYGLLAGGARVGAVTSGGPSPTLGRSIGLGYVPPAHAEVGSQVAVEIRGREVEARICETPFVRARPASP